MKKKYWVGVNNQNTIAFYDNDPSNIEGLQAIRNFEVNNDGSLSGVDVTCLHPQEQGSTQTQQTA
jgi:hypothetical protein